MNTSIVDTNAFYQLKWITPTKVVQDVLTSGEEVVHFMMTGDLNSETLIDMYEVPHSLNLESNMNKHLLEQATAISNTQHGFFGDGNDQVFYIYTQLSLNLENNMPQITHAELVDQLRKELIDQYGHRSLSADEDTLISMLDNCEITPAIESIIEELNGL